MILLFISLQIYICILKFCILKFCCFYIFHGSSLLDLFGNLACVNGFITMSISVTSVKRKIESIRNKNSASQVYWGILQYFYLVLGIFNHDFLEQLFSRTTPIVCCRWLVDSYQNKKYLACNTWIVFMLRLVITYPQVQLFVVGFLSFVLRLSKYLFNACDSFKGMLR